MKMQRMAFRDVYRLLADCWRLYQRYAARKLSDKECKQIMMDADRIRKEYDSDLAKDLLIAILRELEKGAK